MIGAGRQDRLRMAALQPAHFRHNRFTVGSITLR
jgi:hypothetical protein